jgi:hypothetical protein
MGKNTNDVHQCMRGCLYQANIDFRNYDDASRLTAMSKKYDF